MLSEWRAALIFVPTRPSVFEAGGERRLTRQASCKCAGVFWWR